MYRPIRVEFSIEGEIVKPFKQKFPELKNFSDKQVMTEIIKAEFLTYNVKDFFNPKYYTTEDIKEIFKI